MPACAVGMNTAEFTGKQTVVTVISSEYLWVIVFVSNVTHIHTCNANTWDLHVAATNQLQRNHAALAGVVSVSTWCFWCVSLARN